MKLPSFLLVPTLALLACLPRFASAQATVDTVYSFSASGGAESPRAGLIQANDGNLYGTSDQGGTSSADGTVFEVSTDGTTYQTAHSFSGGDGSGPDADLIQGSDGNLYGITTQGADDDGTVFMVSADGTTFQTLHTFGGGDGAHPEAGLVQASDGNLYGTTIAGGAHGVGTVFVVSTAGTGFQTLYSFTNGNDGAYPSAALIQASDGNLYGTAAQGGASGHGTVFKVALDGTGFQTLHSFTNMNGDGIDPYAALLQASDGNLYGTTENGGANGDGTVFKVSLDGTAYQIVHSFDFDDGKQPNAGVIQASDGNLYGTTTNGGASYHGTVFMVSTDGTTFASLYGFGGVSGDGTFLFGRVIQAGDGNLYSTAGYGGANSYGEVFRVDVSLPAVVQFHQAINSVSETAGTASVRVDRIGDDGSSALSVDYATADGTALHGTDYMTASGTLTWGQGDVLPKFIQVPITNRGLTDSSLRTLSLTLSNVQNTGGSGTTLGYPTTATLTINDSIPGAPVITSAQTASVAEGMAFSYQITANADPTSYGASGLPAGLSVNTTTGAITGAPTVYGVFSVTLSATNAAGPGTATLTLTVAQSAPVITSALTATAVVGESFSYQITAGNQPTSFNATGLPSGLSVNKTTGVISGTPASTAAGTKTLTLKATNAIGTGTVTLTLTVNRPAPVITSALTATATAGESFSYQIKATNDPTSYNATGKPAGLSLDTSTGVISGTLASTSAGTKTLTLMASNVTGQGTATLTLTVNPPAPAITSAKTASATIGQPFSYQIKATNKPTSYGATGLPKGLSVNTSTGVISGTPASSAAGTKTLTLKATNVTGTGEETLTLTIKPS